MRQGDFIKPNMTGLRESAGKKIVEQLKNSKVESDENIREKVFQYKKAIMDERKKQASDHSAIL